MAYALRARGAGELVDATFRIYRAHWWTMVKTVGVLLLPIGLLQAGLQAYARLMLQRIGTGPTPNPGALFGFMGLSFGMQIPALIYALATMVADAAVTKETGEACHGAVPTMGAAWQTVRERLGPIIGAGALALVFVGIGVCCCLIGAPVASVFLTAFIPIVVLERANVGDALSRSFKLISPGFWRVLWTQIVIFLIMIVPYFLLWLVVGLVFLAGSSNFMDMLQSFSTAGPLYTLLLYLISSVYTVTMAPIYSIAKTLIYFDLRIRQEGYDLERAAAETGMTTGGNTGGPVS